MCIVFTVVSAAACKGDNDPHATITYAHNIETRARAGERGDLVPILVSFVFTFKPVGHADDDDDFVITGRRARIDYPRLSCYIYRYISLKADGRRLAYVSTPRASFGGGGRSCFWRS